MINWTALESSVILAIAYQRSKLFIRFIDNHEYEYHKVPVRIYEQLLHAPSAGQYFNGHVKNHYKFKRIR